VTHELDEDSGEADEVQAPVVWRAATMNRSGLRWGYAVFDLGVVVARLAAGALFITVTE
jgi:hypothetical protein